MMIVDDLLNLIRSMGNVNNEAGSSSSRCYENPSDASRAKKGGNRRRKDVKNPWQHKQDKESRERESLTPLPREQENYYSEEQNNDMQGMFFEEDGIRYEWGTTGMVCSRVDGGVGDIRDGDVSQNEENLGLGGGQESDLDVGVGAGDVVGVDGGVEMNVDDDGVGDEPPEVEYIGRRSRVQRKSRARTCMRSEYKHPLLKTIADFVLHYGGLSPHNQSTFDPVVIRCCGEDATFRVVSTVISPIGLLHIQYVRVVAMMYGRVWAKRYEGRSRRIMLDPAFAQLVLTGSQDHESVSASDVIQRTVARIQDKDRIPTYSLNMVFVPVYEGGRWWCLIFSFNRAEIVVVDAAFSKRASEVHHLSVGKLTDPCYGFGSTTGRPNLANWFNVGYETGVVMLEVVKECSDRLLQSYDVGGFAEQRLRLLCDDITCDFNEVKHETEAFLNSWRIRRSRN
ncbi:Protein MULTIPOLAR SPINDLE 1 [Bienertia sinuspersici]